MSLDQHTCITCREAQAVIDDECIACAVKFYTENPAEFDPVEKCWTSDAQWREAANQIITAIRKDGEPLQSHFQRFDFESAA